MGSIIPTKRVNKRTGKTTTTYRAHVRRTGFAPKSKVCKTEHEAKEWLRNNDADATQVKASNRKSLSSLIEDFVQAPPSKGSMYWRESHLEFWIKQIGAMPVFDISRGDINGAKAKLQNRMKMRSVPGGAKDTREKLTPATINRYLASLSSVFNYAMEYEIIDTHPMKGGKVRKVKEGGGRTRVLSPDEEQRLLTAAKASTWPMMYLFLRMALTTAARRGELLRLRWRDIRMDDSIAVLSKTKNGTARSLPLVSDVKAVLTEAMKVRPLHSDFVFFSPKDPTKAINPQRPWQQCREAAGLLHDRDDPMDQVVLHSTRHTSITKMVKGGANLAQVASVSGHKTLAMLKRYEHLAAADSVELAERLLSGNSQNK